MESHQDIIAQVDVLDLLQSGDVLLVELLIVFLPLERSAYLLDVVLQFQKKSLHGLLAARLNDVHLLLHLLFENYEPAALHCESVDARAGQADLLLWKVSPFLRKENQLRLADLCAQLALELVEEEGALKQLVSGVVCDF